MARAEEAIYGGYSIGGASGNDPHGFYGFHEDETAAFFRCVFLIEGSDYTDLATKCNAAEAALKKPYQKLELKWQGVTQFVYDPDPSAATVANQATGFDAEAQLRVVEELSIALTRAYEFRVKIQLPPSYNDANLPGTPPARGRRTASVNLHADKANRKVVTISGVYTELPIAAGGLPRTFTAAGGIIDTFCAARLALVDNAITWELTRREEEDNNTQAILRFTREYSEHVNGRRGSSPEISKLPSGLRIVVIKGNYIRTLAPAKAASVNYADYEPAHSAAVLAALTTDQGGPLTVATDCELVSEIASPNEQDDRLDFQRVYRELIWKQSSAASGLDDPDILLDSVTFAISRNPTNDSPVPGATPAPAGVAGAVQQDAPSNPYTGTIERNQAPPVSANTGTVSSSPGTSLAQKPVDVSFVYKATLKKTVANIKAKWDAVIRPFLLGKFAEQVGLAPVEHVGDILQEDPTTMSLVGVVRGRAYLSAVVAFLVSETIEDDIGLRLSPAFNGVPHSYLIQQANPKRTKRRTIRAVYRTGQFSLDKFQGRSAVPGYVIVARAQLAKIDRVVGIPSMGIGQIGLTSDGFLEDAVYVAQKIAGSTGPNGAAPGGAAGAGGGAGAGGAAGGAGGGPAAAQAASSNVKGGGSSYLDAPGQNSGSFAGSDISGVSFGL